MAFNLTGEVQGLVWLLQYEDWWHNLSSNQSHELQLITYISSFWRPGLNQNFFHEDCKTHAHLPHSGWQHHTTKKKWTSRLNKKLHFLQKLLNWFINWKNHCIYAWEFLPGFAQLHKYIQQHKICRKKLETPEKSTVSFFKWQNWPKSNPNWFSIYEYITPQKKMQKKNPQCLSLYFWICLSHITVETYTISMEKH